MLAGSEDEYHFDCPLDNFFFGFAEIKGDDFKDFVATGATDDEVAGWITQNAKQRERSEIVEWNNDLRYKRISELPTELQIFMEDYIPENLPTPPTGLRALRCVCYRRGSTLIKTYGGNRQKPLHATCLSRV